MATDLHMALPSEASLLRIGDQKSLKREQLETAKSTVTRADSLLAGIQSRILELNKLQDAARNTSAALKDLLTLKYVFSSTDFRVRMLTGDKGNSKLVSWKLAKRSNKLLRL